MCVPRPISGLERCIRSPTPVKLGVDTSCCSERSSRRTCLKLCEPPQSTVYQDKCGHPNAPDPALRCYLTERMLGRRIRARNVACGSKSTISVTDWLHFRSAPISRHGLRGHRHVSKVPIAEVNGGQFGVADRWKWTICQSAPRLAMTNVSRPAKFTGLSATTPTIVSKPATTTVVSEICKTECSPEGWSIFSLRNTPSKYLRMPSGEAMSALLPVPIITASAA